LQGTFVATGKGADHRLQQCQRLYTYSLLIRVALNTAPPALWKTMQQMQSTLMIAAEMQFQVDIFVAQQNSS
jgi:hypothetical protein